MTLRIALALLVIVPAAMAYPWHSVTERWILGVAVAVVLIVFGWWRGLFVTTMIARRFAVARRNNSKPKSRPSNQVSVLLRVNDPAGVGLPLPLVGRYVDRFGIRCDKLRVTSRDKGGTRTTWIGMTLDATENLAALQARSPELPLYDTAEVVGRRLADHLRETGLEAVIVDDADAPLTVEGRETWTGFRDDLGFVSAYQLPVDDRLPERLAEVWARPTETWTALEFSGTTAHPTAAAVCAFRTTDAQTAPPLPWLVVHRGVQRPLLTELDPCSALQLGVTAGPLPAGLTDRVDWHVNSVNPSSLEQTRL